MWKLISYSTRYRYSRHSRVVGIRHDILAIGGGEFEVVRELVIGAGHATQWSRVAELLKVTVLRRDATRWEELDDTWKYTI